jgi:hypothetical protein
MFDGGEEDGKKQKEFEEIDPDPEKGQKPNVKMLQSIQS